MERDWGVLEVDNLGVLGVELTRDKVFGRLRFCWTSCMEVKPDCCWRRLLDDEGGILYGQVRCLFGLVAVLLRSGAAMVTFREGILTPGEVGLCASKEFGLREIPDNGGVVSECCPWLKPPEERALVHSWSLGCSNSIPPSLKPNMD